VPPGGWTVITWQERCLSQAGNLGAGAKNIFFGVTQAKPGNSRMRGKLIRVDSFPGKSNNHHFKEITVEIFENLQAIAILTADQGLVAVLNLVDRQVILLSREVKRRLRFGQDDGQGWVTSSLLLVSLRK
jgi:hypothetical protein